MKKTQKKLWAWRSLYIPTRGILLIFISFNFDFLALYKWYFQNYFANRSIKLESFTSHLQHLRPCCISVVTECCSLRVSDCDDVPRVSVKTRIKYILFYVCLFNVIFLEKWSELGFIPHWLERYGTRYFYKWLDSKEWRPKNWHNVQHTTSDRSWKTWYNFYAS